MAGRGRPSKLTVAVTKKIAADIRGTKTRGPMPATLAAMRHGVSRTTYHRWMAEGASDTAEKHFRDFRDAIDQALADAAMTLLEPLNREPSVSTSQYMLSHMFPEEFGNRVAHSHSGTVEGKLDFRSLLDADGDE